MTATLIDIHPHIISHDTARYPVTPIGGKQSDWSKERSVTMEELILAMDEAGVAKAAIVHSSTTYGFNNAYLADSIAEHPGRFAGVFSVDITQSDAPERMRYWHGRGMAGLRIYARGSTMAKEWLAIDDPATMPAWECAAELGISVASNLNARDGGLDQIRTILQRFPTVPLIIEHFGRPSIADGPPYAAAKAYFDLADFPNMHLKFTRSGLDSMIKGEATPESFMAKVVSVFGAERIAWGSNFPSAPGSFAQIIESARAACRDLSDHDRRWIFGGTAQKLYPTLAD